MINQPDQVPLNEINAAEGINHDLLEVCKAAHTPGPWKVGYIGSGVFKQTIILDSIGGQMATVFSGYGPGEDKAYEEQKANAHLIAAAPELKDELHDSTECLKSALDELLEGHVKTIVREQIEINLQILARAEGRA